MFLRWDPSWEWRHSSWSGSRDVEGTLFWKEMFLFTVSVSCLGFINQVGYPVGAWKDFCCARACSQWCSQEVGCSLALQLGELWLGEEGTWMFSWQLQLRKRRWNVSVWKITGDWSLPGQVLSGILSVHFSLLSNKLGVGSCLLDSLKSPGRSLFNDFIYPFSFPFL